MVKRIQGNSHLSIFTETDKESGKRTNTEFQEYIFDTSVALYFNTKTGFFSVLSSEKQVEII